MKLVIPIAVLAVSIATLGAQAPAPVGQPAQPACAVRFRSVLPIEGSRLSYEFSGRLSGDRMEGELNLGEYPKARWSAVRHAQDGPPPADPSKAGKAG